VAEKVQLVMDGMAAKLKIPKELWQLVDYLYKYGIRDGGLFQESGDLFETKEVREMIDSGKSLSEFRGSIHSVSECLFSFLESLTEPVIPYQFYASCISACETFSAANQQINKLPPVHYNTFHYIMAFLREVLQNSDANKLTAD